MAWKMPRNGGFTSSTPIFSYDGRSYRESSHSEGSMRNTPIFSYDGRSYRESSHNDSCSSSYNDSCSSSYNNSRSSSNAGMNTMSLHDSNYNSATIDSDSSTDSSTDDFDVNSQLDVNKGKLDFLGIGPVMKSVSGYLLKEGKNYKILFDNDANLSATTEMNIIDQRLPSAKQISKGKTATPKGDWVLRADKPHKGVEFNHININPSISGRVDPHLKLSPKCMESLIVSIKTAKLLAKLATPIAIAADAVEISEAVKKDQKNSTTRNTTEAAASVIGGWGGAYAGVLSGALLGTRVFPGVGTILGGVIGGVVGSFGGTKGAKAAAESLGDAFDYDMVEGTCDKCHQKYRERTYDRGDSSSCSSCLADELNDLISEQSKAIYGYYSDDSDDSD